MVEEYLNQFEKLNEYQKRAVVCEEPYQLVNAAVGSGKTTVLVHKVLYLHIIEKVELRDICVITFTNKAAGEIKQRIGEFTNINEGDFKYFGTFHSVARTILNESDYLEMTGFEKDFSILDTNRSSEVLNELIEENKLNIKYAAKLSKRIEGYKNGKALFGSMKKQDDIGELIKLYRHKKQELNAMDFDDLITKCIEVLREPMGFKWIIIDELQDTDEEQLLMIESMASKNTKIFAVGDPNQVIYSFRTGASNIFKSFEKKFSPKMLTLPLNYRSTRTIIEAAQAFIGNKDIEGVKDYGSPIIVTKHHDAFNEALHISSKIKEFNLEGVPYSSIAILYRRQAQGEILKDCLERQGIPVKTSGDDESEKRDMVSLLTLHASKGLEFSHVFIAGVNMGNIPLTTKRSEEAEEARLFFVGITRAKTYLEISYLSRPSIQGMLPYASPYISMISPKLTKREDKEGEMSLKELSVMLREERQKKLEGENIKKAVHPKYGEGTIIYQDENVVKVEFEGYGEKEFSMLFCPLKFL